VVKNAEEERLRKFATLSEHDDFQSHQDNR
jgi:hypothetical protein